jgi:hypothetical protein
MRMSIAAGGGIFSRGSKYSAESVCKFCGHRGTKGKAKYEEACELEVAGAVGY